MRERRAGARQAAPSATAQPVAPAVPLVRSELEVSALVARLAQVELEGGALVVLVVEGALLAHHLAKVAACHAACATQATKT